MIIKNITLKQNIAYHPALGWYYDVELENGFHREVSDDELMGKFPEYQGENVNMLIGKLWN